MRRVHTPATYQFCVCICHSLHTRPGHQGGKVEDCWFRALAILQSGFENEKERGLLQVGSKTIAYHC